MSGSLAVLGLLLILFAIPFGLMLAPLAIGIIVLVVALRRMDRSASPTGRRLMGDLVVLVLVVVLRRPSCSGRCDRHARPAAVADSTATASFAELRAPASAPGSCRPTSALVTTAASRMSSVTPSA